jgi:UDP-N-acetylmuramoyl-tripeptide--D-alanyl-D-alanine ligase
MNRPGEIAELAKVLNPDLALITNIGSAHIGILGSRQAIVEEKKKIFSEFKGNNTALIPVNDDFCDFLAKGIRGRTIFYGTSTFSALGAVQDLGLGGTQFVWDGEPVRFGLPGKFNFQNALAAAALALELPVNAASIRRGLESVKPLFGRGEIFHGRTTLIRDCYNSNPESVEAALDFCDSLEWQGRKVYVIGSMLELGDASPEAHAALGRRLAFCRANMVFLFGGEICFSADALEQAVRKDGKDQAGKVPFFHTNDRNTLSGELDAYVKTGDLVLLKGSRGCELETLTEMLLGDSYVS